MKTERKIVNNCVFLLGLDETYRESMKQHERDELLRLVAKCLCIVLRYAHRLARDLY
jgi:hypothetical protein